MALYEYEDRKFLGRLEGVARSPRRVHSHRRIGGGASWHSARHPRRDIFVRQDPENIEKLRGALAAVFKDEAIVEITSEELQKYQVIRYGTPHDYYIGIVARIGEAFSYDDLKYEMIASGGVAVRVATIETLIALKKNTPRPRDQADIMYLMEKLQEKNK